MKVLVTGSSGFVGSALVRTLAQRGHEVLRLVRSRLVSRSEFSWDPTRGHINLRALEDQDAVIHLAGENVAEGRWTSEKKNRILESRVQGTQLIARSMAKVEHPPEVLLSASGIGMYGDRGDEVLSEDSALGTGFLAEVGRQWEAAARPASEKGIRVVHLRIGLVLGLAGGALAKMLPPFRMGLGGPLGHGRQYMSWISIDDLVQAIEHAMVTKSLAGPVNLVAPDPVTNLEFTRTLGRVLGRPAVIPAPAFLLKLALGGVANELLLASTRVQSTRLKESGYSFKHANLEAALRNILGKK